jgi:hypothetical protein
MPLPDVHPAFRQLLAGKTRAGANVSTELPRGAAFPRIRYYRDGGPYRGINTEDSARMVVESWGNTREEAYLLALEVKSVVSPEAWPVGTYVGAVGGVFFSGGYEEGEPRWVPDLEADTPRYIQSFVLHYRAA